jgi:hypothetical protein
MVVEAWPLLGGQKCPSGSMGLPHKAQMGRPAAASFW